MIPEVKPEINYAIIEPEVPKIDTEAERLRELKEAREAKEKELKVFLDVFPRLERDYKKVYENCLSRFDLAFKIEPLKTS